MEASSAVAAPGTREEGDDFYCHKYQVWYRVVDCVYRGKNKTFAGCVNCFQGHINIRCLEKGMQPPIMLGSEPSTQRPAGGGSGALLMLRRVE